jgi:sulfite exporter TauE/SafE/copper chaperone CopZ
MEQELIRQTLHIDGMTCTGCVTRIENALRKIGGVVEAEAVFSSSVVYVAYDANKTGLDQITASIEKLGYTVRSAGGRISAGQTGSGSSAGQKGGRNIVGQLTGIGIIILALWLVFGNTDITGFVPEIDQSMSFGVLFVVGLLTSVHCVAMCGGINMSQCVSYRSVSIADIPVSIDNRTDDGISTGRAVSSKISMGRLIPSILYNGGRVVSYTVIGGFAGSLGSAVSFSGAAKGIVAVISGLFMVIMGLNMLNIFPWLRKLTPRMPKIFGEKVSNGSRKYGPFIVGLLNGLMPCGPLQSMQLYALGTGSFAAGALSMFMFSIGTVPLMFGLGVLSSILTGKFTHRMLKASAILVTALGIVMIGRGLVLSGVDTAFAASREGNIARIENGVQVVTTELEPGRYTPIVVQKGIPVRWTIKTDKGDLNGCNNPITIPRFGIQQRLTAGDNLIAEFTPDTEGTIPYTCWMGMISSYIKVVPDISAVSAEGTDISTDGETGWDFSLQCFTGVLNGYVKVVEDINVIDLEQISKEAGSYRPPAYNYSSIYGDGAGCH